MNFELLKCDFSTRRGNYVRETLNFQAKTLTLRGKDASEVFEGRSLRLESIEKVAEAKLKITFVSDKKNRSRDETEVITCVVDEGQLAKLKVSLSRIDAQTEPRNEVSTPENSSREAAKLVIPPDSHSSLAIDSQSDIKKLQWSVGDPRVDFLSAKDWNKLNQLPSAMDRPGYYPPVSLKMPKTAKVAPISSFKLGKMDKDSEDNAREFLEKGKIAGDLPKTVDPLDIELKQKQFSQLISNFPNNLAEGEAPWPQMPVAGQDFFEIPEEDILERHFRLSRATREESEKSSLISSAVGRILTLFSSKRQNYEILEPEKNLRFLLKNLEDLLSPSLDSSLSKSIYATNDWALGITSLLRFFTRSTPFDFFEEVSPSYTELPLSLFPLRDSVRKLINIHFNPESLLQQIPDINELLNGSAWASETCSFAEELFLTFQETFRISAMTLKEKTDWAKVALDAFSQSTTGIASCMRFIFFKRRYMKLNKACLFFLRFFSEQIKELYVLFICFMEAFLSVKAPQGAPAERLISPRDLEASNTNGLTSDRDSAPILRNREHVKESRALSRPESDRHRAASSKKVQSSGGELASEQRELISAAFPDLSDKLSRKKSLSEEEAIHGLIWKVGKGPFGVLLEVREEIEECMTFLRQKPNRPVAF